MEICGVCRCEIRSRESGVRESGTGSGILSKSGRLHGAAASNWLATSRLANRRIVDLEVRNGKGSGINDLQMAKRRHLTLPKAIHWNCKLPNFSGLAATWENPKVKSIFAGPHEQNRLVCGTPIYLGHPP